MNRTLFAAACALSLLVACEPPAPGNPDSCPPGEPFTRAVTVSCSVVRADGGAAEGVAARCSHTDAGATTDSTGAFSLYVNERTCGIATGSTDCGAVSFVEDGGTVEVSFENESNFQTEVFAQNLKARSDGCRLVTR